MLITRYAQAIPTRNQTARTTAEVLFNNYIVHYGIPERLHSDQGANFESKVIEELCRMTRLVVWDFGQTSDNMAKNLWNHAVYSCTHEQEVQHMPSNFSSVPVPRSLTC
jgi:hypothetical protein